MYLFILSTLMYFTVNIPIVITIAYHWSDKKVLFRLFSGFPNQFLFLAIFLLGSLYLFNKAANLEYNYLKSKYPKNLRIIIILASIVGFFLCCYIGYESKISSPPKIHTLRMLFAQAAINAQYHVLQQGGEGPITPSLKSDLEQLKAWLGISGNENWLNYEGKKTEEIKKAIYFTHDIINGKLERNELTRKSLSKVIFTNKNDINHLNKAIPFLQIFQDSHHIKKIEEVFPDLIIADKWLINSNLIEEIAVFFLVWNFLMLTVGLICIKKFGFPNNAPLNQDIIKIVTLLYFFITIFAFWVIFRIFTIQEKVLVFGGGEDSWVPVLLAIILIAASGIYLLSIVSSGLLNKLINLIPPLVITIGGLVGLNNPFFISKNFGTLIENGYYTIVIIVLSIIIGIFFFMIWEKNISPKRKPKKLG